MATFTISTYEKKISYRGIRAPGDDAVVVRCEITRARETGADRWPNCSADMLIAAAQAIADCVSPSELNATSIVPSVFAAAVALAVAAAVRASAERSTTKRSTTERGGISDE